MGLDGGRVALEAEVAAVRVEEELVAGVVVTERLGEVATLVGTMARFPIPKGPWFLM